MMDNVHIYDHPLIHHKISYLRDKTTSTADFRNLVEELALLMAFEVLADLPTYDVSVETPLATAECRRVHENGLVIVPILRAMVTISSLSMPISGQNSGIFSTAPVTAIASIVWLAT